MVFLATLTKSFLLLILYVFFVIFLVCFSYGFFCIFILKILLHFFGIFHISFEIETANVKTYAFTQIVNFFCGFCFSFLHN